MMRPSLSRPALAAVAAGLFLAPGAAAAGADGAWLCIANGNIPIGIVTISGASYDFVTTNTAWEPVENAANGGGSVDVAGNTVTPLDGPLKTDFEVTGEIEGERLYWMNSAGTLMSCSR